MDMLDAVSLRAQRSSLNTTACSFRDCRVALWVPRNDTGTTLLELITVVVILIIILTTLISGYKTRIINAKLEETVDEMSSLAKASVDFYNTKGQWPSSPNDLSGVNMYKAVGFSPFGGAYQFVPLNHAMTVSTQVPSGIAKNYDQGSLLQVAQGGTNDTISVTTERPNELSGRLDYAKKYIN